MVSPVAHTINPMLEQLPLWSYITLVYTLLMCSFGYTLALIIGVQRNFPYGRKGTALCCLLAATGCLLVSGSGPSLTLLAALIVLCPAVLLSTAIGAHCPISRYWDALMAIETKPSTEKNKTMTTESTTTVNSINGIPVTCDAGINLAAALTSAAFTEFLGTLDTTTAGAAAKSLADYLAKLNEANLKTALTAKPLTDLLAKIDRENFVIKGVHVQSFDMFGPRVGFIKFVVDVTDKQGTALPAIVFARGGAVAVMGVLVCEGEEHVVLTVQPRIPTGEFNFEEIVAGMLDGSGNFGGVAAKELKEEAGIALTAADLTNLSELAGHDTGVYLSPGACDETIRFFAFRRNVTRAELNEINGRCTGVIEEGEKITLKIVKLDYLLSVNDAKTLVGYLLYNKFRDQVKVS